MDEHDDTAAPDTVILGGGPRKEEPQEPWGGAVDDSLEAHWGGGNDLDTDPEAPWEQEKNDEQPFAPDPAMFEGLEDEEAGPEKKRFKLNKKWIMISGIALMVLAVGLVSIFMIKNTLDSPPEKSAEVPLESSATAVAPVSAQVPAVSNQTVENYRGTTSVRLELEPFVIPYEESSKKTFLFLRVALEIDEKETYALLEANKPLLRGVIYDTVLEEMERVGDKDAFNGAMENLIAAKLKSVFSTLGIKKVRFTNHYSV
ncbi:MAG: hypothetical protein JEZ02_15480 [Desulfatibacillum sp.]|nr:hypothetical protein [Desulfatibacillum sp.]